MNAGSQRTTAFDQEIDHFDVRRVTSFNSMFRNANSFNRSISSWELSTNEVLTLTEMFLSANDFEQDLCQVFQDVRLTPSDVQDMFLGTSCPEPADPDVDAVPMGPFCYPC